MSGYQCPDCGNSLANEQACPCGSPSFSKVLNSLKMTRISTHHELITKLCPVCGEIFHICKCDYELADEKR